MMSDAAGIIRKVHEENPEYLAGKLQILLMTDEELARSGIGPQVRSYIAAEIEAMLGDGVTDACIDFASRMFMHIKGTL